MTVDEGTPASVRFRLLGASPTALTGRDPLPGKVNYFIGSDPADWQTGLPTCRKAEGREVYPGIDVVYHGTGEQLELDFMVAPGADPSAIVLRIDGADRLSVNAQGDLVIATGRDELRQHKPVAYQTIAGQRREVPAAFRLRDANTVVFDLGGYDRRQPLVIDPVLSYSTYFGGNGADSGWAIAVDAAGSAFIAGTTLSTRLRELPTPGAFQTNYAGGGRAGGDGFVAKLNASGTAFDYITYLGGRHEDGIIDLAIDPAGNAYVVGYTDSTNFPVTLGAFQPKNAGTNDPSVNLPFTDAFITKLDPAGSALVYSTYLGGPGAEAGYGIAVDSAGQAHVIGYTDSAVVFRVTNEVRTTVCTNVICDTNGCVVNRICGPTKYVTNTAFAGSISPSLMISNFGIIIDQKAKKTNLTETIIVTTPIDAAFITSGFPVANPYQANNNSVVSYDNKRGRATNYTAGTDAFITKFSADGSTLIYSTYLGGCSDDLGTGIAVDAAGDTTVCGWTRCPDFPLVRPLQTELYGLQAGFVTKLDPSGTALIYSTFLGGIGGTFANRATVDAQGNSYIIGSKSGNSFPSTPDALNRGGIFRSADAAASWIYSGDGLEHPLVQSIVIDPDAPATLYAGTPRGVFKSTDGGALWRNRSAGIFTPIVRAIALDPTRPLRLYAGTIGQLYVSLDAGLTWIATSNGLRNDTINAIAVSPDDPSLLYLGTQRGVFRSTNSAISFDASSSGLGNTLVNALIIDPADSNTLYAATQGGVYKSTNGAVRWRGSSIGLSSTIVKALTQDPADPDVLYAGTTRGFFKSTNAAANWFNLTNGIGRPFITSLALDSSAPGVLYAGTTNGIFRSIDAGVSWVATTNGLSPLNVASLAVDGSTLPATIHAGLYGTNSFGGTNDAFLTKIAPDGSRFDYSVVFGGSRGDEGWDVAVDAAGSAFVIGATTSVNFPTNSAPGLSQTRLAGGTDAFLGQFNPGASAWVYSFYLGGKATDYGYSIALDPFGNAFAAGATFSGNFPVTNAVQTRVAGSSDAFVTKVVNPPPPARSGKQ